MAAGDLPTAIFLVMEGGMLIATTGSVKIISQIGSVKIISR